MNDANNKLSWNMSTRNQIRSAKERVFSDETLSEREKIETLIEILERAKVEAVAERARDSAPRTTLDRVNAAFNAMVIPPDRPLEDDIDKVIAELKAILREATTE